MEHFDTARKIFFSKINVFNKCLSMQKNLRVPDITNWEHVQISDENENRPTLLHNDHCRLFWTECNIPSTVAKYFLSQTDSGIWKEANVHVGW